MKTQQITNIRAKKINVAIDNYGSTLILRSQGVRTKNEYGEYEHGGYTDTSTVGVIYNNFDYRAERTDAGRLKDASATILLKGTETIDETYRVVIDNVEYNIIELTPIKAANVVAVWQLLVGRKNV